MQRGTPGPPEDEVSPESMKVLQDRLAQLRDGGPAASASSAAAAGPSSGDQASLNDAPGAAGRSFSDSDDGELTSALNRRISEIATATGEWGASVDEEAMRRPLDGEVRGGAVMGVD
jgi:hypothetical protein